MKLCTDIVPKRGLRIYHDSFECPYCGHFVYRGGHAEGFRKSGMSNHVFVCWQILLFQAGYVVGNYVSAEAPEDATDPRQSDDGRCGEEAVPIGDMKAKAWFDPKRVIRALKANVRSRVRAGLTPKVPV